MNLHLRKDLENLKSRILRVAVAVEENVARSVNAIGELSEDGAKKVVGEDTHIDKMEVDTEEECLKILALHQPVASDLRFVITVLKINNELEHIGDMACNIVKRIRFIKERPIGQIPFNLDMISRQTIKMLKDSLDAFIREDEFLALQVCEDDKIIDDENRDCYLNVGKAISEDINSAMTEINYLLISKAFERIADLCTNIAEDVIYMKYSIIVRHNMKDSQNIRRYFETQNIDKLEELGEIGGPEE